MKLRFSLFLFISFLFLEAQAFQEVNTKTNQEMETEAGLNDKTASADFCCDRERVQDSVQDMSKKEARRIVNSFLGSSPASAPHSRKGGKGQRGQR